MYKLGVKNFNPNQPGNSYIQLVKKTFEHKKSKITKYKTTENSLFGDYYYPSLWGYYNLLPTELRNHPFIMTMVQGLEKHFYSVNPNLN